MKKDDNILLSVAIISYNQEKYIAEAIESVLAQKVNFNYELLLADDCSKDNTLKIMKEYEKKYPEIIRVLDRKHNLGANNNQVDAARNGRGKYFTLLEGDDYWIDENKIQTQVDFLESHPDYIGVSHLQQGVDENGNKLGIFPTWIKKDGEITMKNFVKAQNYSSSTCLFRNYFKIKEYKKELDYYFSLHALAGDIQSGFFELKHGRIYNFAKPMMAYRIVKKQGAENYNSRNSTLDIILTSTRILSEIDKYNNYKYNFWKRYASYFAGIFMLSIVNRKNSKIKDFFEICPKKYHFKVKLYLPIACTKKVFNKIKGMIK